MFFIMYGYKSVWIRSLSDVEVRKSCIKEVFAFLWNRSLKTIIRTLIYGKVYLFDM